MAGERRDNNRLTWVLTVCVAAPAAAALIAAWAAADGLSHLRRDVLRVSGGPVAALAPATRLMQAADGLGGAAARLLWADDQQGRSAARAAADLHRGALADHFADGGLLTRPIADELERFDALLAAADALAARRLEALTALPTARERLVVLAAGLDALLAERRSELAALSRFHPDTQRELERHDEWRRASKLLLGSLLLTANAAGGHSGAASAAAAHLARMNQIVDGLPESDFAQMARRQQQAVANAVVGPAGALTQLAALRTAQDEAADLAVEARRLAMDLSQAGGDHVGAVRAEIDAGLTAAAAYALDRQFVAAAAGMGGLLAAGVGVVVVRRGVASRLRRLRRAIFARGRPAEAAPGGDEIGVLGQAAQELLDHVARRDADLDSSRARFDLAVHASDAAMWDENLSEGRVWWSPGYYRLLGYDEDEISPTVGAWEMLVHPDDRAAAAEAAERCLAGLTDRYAAVYRMRRKDGGWVWVEDHGSVQRDGDGLPARFVGMMRDVSRRRQAELRQRRAREKAEAAARGGAELLSAAERRLRPDLRRLSAKLSQLESWALTDEQRRLVGDVRQECRDVLETLTALRQSADAAEPAPPSVGGEDEAPLG